MSIQTKIADYLQETFSGKACNICNNRDNECRCDEMDCNSFFYLGTGMARELADEILDIVKRGM